MAKKLVVHAGGIFPNPALNREGAASVDTLPATIGVFDNGKFKASVDGTEPGIKYIANSDYLRCKGINDVIEAGAVIVGIHPISGMFFNLRAAVGNYKKGEALRIDNGTVKTGGDATSQFYSEETVTIAAGDFLRVAFK